MYAVIEAGGKQYRVEVGTELEIDLIDAAPGDSLAIERVLLVADGDSASIGRPTVANASVAAEVVGRERGEKVISFKYRPKARRRVKKGHRQELTRIRISDIVLDGRSAAGEQAKADESRKTERQRLEEAARRQAEQDAALAAKLAQAKAAASPAGEVGETARPAKTAKAAGPAKGRATKTEAAKTEAAKAADTAKTAGTAKAKAAGTTKAAGTAKASPKAAKATTKTDDEASTGGKAAEQTAAKPRRTRKGGPAESTE